MKYLKRYETFINDVIQNASLDIDRGISIVEKQVLNDFSGGFWEMSLNSTVFTTEEKSFIKENLLSIKIDLVNEGWLTDPLGKILDRAKEKGGKIWDKVKSKITIIKNNIKKLVMGVSDFVKNLLKSLGNLVINKSKGLKNKIKADFPNKVKGIFSKNKPDPDKLKTEIQQLKETVEYLQPLITSGVFANFVDASDDKVASDAEGQIGELENELKTELIHYDILGSFYITEADGYKVGDVVRYKKKDGTEGEKPIVRIDGDNFVFKDKEGKEFIKSKVDIIGNKGIGSTTWGGFSKWFLDMEKSTPPEGGKGKAVWWIKLILKIIGLILSPIVKALEIAVKFIATNVLKGVSWITKEKLKGPGIYEFIILSGVIAGIGALTTEISLVSHKMPEPWAHIFEVISIFLTEASGIKSLLMVFGAFCAAMTLYQLIVEFKHLFGGEHGGEHAGSEHKPEAPTPA